MLTRADVERIIENKLADNNVLTEENLVNLLKKNLTIEVKQGGQFDYDRIIMVKFNGILIGEAGFDID